MTDAPKLLPCPFCGCTDIGHTSEDDVAIACLDCFGRGPFIEGSREDAATWDRARTAWNTRSDISAAREAKLVAALLVYADSCDASDSAPCGYEGCMCCRTARAVLADLGVDK